MDNKKGIELVKAGSSSGVSITIGSTTFKPQGHPTTVRFEKQIAYVYMLIDTSGSMAGDKLDQAKKGIMDFSMDALRKEYAVGLISFNSKAKNICEPTHHLEVLGNHVSEMNAQGTTNMADAINLAHEYFNSLNSTRVMVIATDGLPDNEKQALEEATKAKEHGIDIITIGTDDANQEFLKKLASRSELGKKVDQAVFSQAISSASNLLPSPKSIKRR